MFFRVTLFLVLFGGIVIADDQRPNILFILGDNWSAPHVGAMGDKTVRTPVFDRLAKEGVLFENAFCPVPSCSPTRSCLLTGRPSHQLREGANLWGSFPGEFTPFPDLLERVGYDVGFCSKGWSPGKYLEFGHARNPAGTDYNVARNTRQNMTRDEWQFAGFQNFLDQRDQRKPFFFWLGLINPSRPTWQDEQGIDRGLDPATVEVPPWLPDVPEVRMHLLDYYASVERLDDMAGEALRLLEEQGALKSTIVVYTGDNGWQLPRGLANVYDGGSHVPLVVKLPDSHQNAPRGLRRQEFVSLTDLCPTFLEWAGATIRDNVTATSIHPLLISKEVDTTRDGVFLERERHANVREGDLGYPMRAIRTKRFLYIHNLKPERWPAGDPELWFAVGPYGDVDDSPTKQFLLKHRSDPEYSALFDLAFAKRPAEELYDLDQDPGQMRNVADLPEYAETLGSLRKRVKDWQTATNDPRCDSANNSFDEYPYYGPRFQQK
ncbi:MAG: sulfatase [Planctomycetaceae bacterium]|nr:sulfatase [Planctomycetaceae bacterium]MCB9951529.1 sulfatase [Planctomycetaceae bacterium]